MLPFCAVTLVITVFDVLPPLVNANTTPPINATTTTPMIIIFSFLHYLNAPPKLYLMFLSIDYKCDVIMKGFS